MTPKPWKRVLWLLAALLAGVTGCEEQQFASIDQHTVTLGDFEGMEVKGQEKMFLDPTGKGYVEVPSDVIHPEFLAHWTNLKIPGLEVVEVDFYVIPYESYVPAKAPEDYIGEEGVLWPRPGGLEFGESRPTEIHLHPAPGRWVLFFYNPKDNTPATRAELSAEVGLNYWK